MQPLAPESRMRLHQEVSVPAADGTRLAADLYLPAPSGRFPTLVLRHPYNRIHADDFVFAHASWYARRGYAVLVQDTRGRFGSEGRFEPFLGEGADGVATLDWVTEQPFCNGRIGMYGFSYAGYTQVAALEPAPASLACICPAMTAADPQHGWVFDGGAFSLAFNASWAMFLGLEDARRGSDAALESRLSKQLASLPLSLEALPLVSVIEPIAGEFTRWFGDWLAHETTDAYWNERDVSGAVATTTVPMLAVGGLFDRFLESTVASYGQAKQGAARQSRLLLGPWQHYPWGTMAGELELGERARNHIDEAQLAFFDQWVAELEEDDSPGVQTYISGANRWQAWDRWPPEATDWTLYCRSSGPANSLSGGGWLSEDAPGEEPPDIFVYDPAFPVPSVGGRSCCFSHISPMGPRDQRSVEALNSVLVYSTRLLERDVLVAGTLRASLYVSTTAIDTDWTLKVCDVFPDGRSFNIQEAIQRARFAGGSDRARPLPAGEVAELGLAIGSCSHLFQRGHRIRLEISSSNFPQWDRNLNTGNPLGKDQLSARVVATQTVFHDHKRPTRLVLPVVE
jgi:putative CocE/NonD family hydrolase